MGVADKRKDPVDPLDCSANIKLEAVSSIWLEVSVSERYLLLEDLETGDVLMPLIYMKAILEANYSRKLASLKNRFVLVPRESVLAPYEGLLYWQWAFESPLSVKMLVRKELGEGNVSQGHLRLVLLPIVYNAMAHKPELQRLPLFQALHRVMQRTSYYPLLQLPSRHVLESINSKSAAERTQPMEEEGGQQQGEQGDGQQHVEPPNEPELEQGVWEQLSEPLEEQGDGQGQRLREQELEQGVGEQLSEPLEEQGDGQGQRLKEQELEQGVGEQLSEPLQEQGDGQGQRLKEQELEQGVGEQLSEPLQEQGDGQGQRLKEQELEQGVGEQLLEPLQEQGDGQGQRLKEQELEQGVGEQLSEPLQEQGDGQGQRLKEQELEQGGGEQLSEPPPERGDGQWQPPQQQGHSSQGEQRRASSPQQGPALRPAVLFTGPSSLEASASKYMFVFKSMAELEAAKRQRSSSAPRLQDDGNRAVRQILWEAQRGRAGAVSRLEQLTVAVAQAEDEPWWSREVGGGAIPLISSSREPGGGGWAGPGVRGNGLDLHSSPGGGQLSVGSWPFGGRNRGAPSSHHPSTTRQVEVPPQGRDSRPQYPGSLQGAPPQLAEAAAQLLAQLPPTGTWDTLQHPPRNRGTTVRQLLPHCQQQMPLQALHGMEEGRAWDTEDPGREQRGALNGRDASAGAPGSGTAPLQRGRMGSSGAAANGKEGHQGSVVSRVQQLEEELMDVRSSLVQLYKSVLPEASPLVSDSLGPSWTPGTMVLGNLISLLSGAVAETLNSGDLCEGAPIKLGWGECPRARGSSHPPPASVTQERGRVVAAVLPGAPARSPHHPYCNKQDESQPGPFQSAQPLHAVGLQHASTPHSEQHQPSVLFKEGSLEEWLGPAELPATSLKGVGSGGHPPATYGEVRQTSMVNQGKGGGVLAPSLSQQPHRTQQAWQPVCKSRKAAAVEAVSMGAGTLPKASLATSCAWGEQGEERGAGGGARSPDAVAGRGGVEEQKWRLPDGMKLDQLAGVSHRLRWNSAILGPGGHPWELSEVPAGTEDSADKDVILELMMELSRKRGA